jgi:hypothetical protein
MRLFQIFGRSCVARLRHHRLHHLLHIHALHLSESDGRAEGQHAGQSNNGLDGHVTIFQSDVYDRSQPTAVGGVARNLCLIGLAARRSFDARRGHSVSHGHVAQKQARETPIERKPKRIRRDDLATGITGRSATVLSSVLPFRVSVPPGLNGQMAHPLNS